MAKGNFQERPTESLQLPTHPVASEEEVPWCKREDLSDWHSTTSTVIQGMGGFSLVFWGVSEEKVSLYEESCQQSSSLVTFNKLPFGYKNQEMTTYLRFLGL